MGKRGIAGQKENGWTFPSLFSNVEFSYDTFSVREHGVSIGWRPLFLEILRSSCLLLDDVEPLDDALVRYDQGGKMDVADVVGEDVAWRIRRTS